MAAAARAAPAARASGSAGDGTSGRRLPVRLVGVHVAAGRERQRHDRRSGSRGRRSRRVRDRAAPDRHDRRPSAAARRVEAHHWPRTTTRFADRSPSSAIASTPLPPSAPGRSRSNAPAWDGAGGLGARRLAAGQPARRRRPPVGRDRLRWPQRRRPRVRPAAGVERVHRRQPRALPRRTRRSTTLPGCAVADGRSARPCRRCRTTGTPIPGWSGRPRTRWRRCWPTSDTGGAETRYTSHRRCDTVPECPEP